MDYQRIKHFCFITDLRQDFRRTVTWGRRSESDKLVEDHWDRLKNIWEVSYAIINLHNARCSVQNDRAGEYNVGVDESQQWYIAKVSITKPPSERLAPTIKFVDNKRKLLVKNLSSNQRDQVYLNLVKENLKLKQNLLHELEEATREFN